MRRLIGRVRMHSRILGITAALACTVAPPAGAQSKAPSKAAPSPASEGEPQNASELFKRLATLTGLEATFVETKKLALLRAPLVSTGLMYYMRPGYLLREIESPGSSRVLITPSTLELQDAQTRRSIDLRARPDVKLFVESFTKVLAGDQAALAKGFDIEFKPRVLPKKNSPPANTKDEWKLLLVPKAPPLSHLVKQLELTGRGYAVERIRVVETKGDTSEIVLTVKSIRRVYSPAEKERLFGLKDTSPPPRQ